MMADPLHMSIYPWAGVLRLGILGTTHGTILSTTIALGLATTIDPIGVTLHGIGVIPPTAIAMGTTGPTTILGTTGTMAIMAATTMATMAVTTVEAGAAITMATIKAVEIEPTTSTTIIIDIDIVARHATTTTTTLVHLVAPLTAPTLLLEQGLRPRRGITLVATARTKALADLVAAIEVQLVAPTAVHKATQVTAPLAAAMSARRLVATTLAPLQVAVEATTPVAPQGVTALRLPLVADALLAAVAKLMRLFGSP